MTSPPYWEQAVLLWNKAQDEAPSSAIRAIAEALGDADHQSFKRGYETACRDSSEQEPS